MRTTVFVPHLSRINIYIHVQDICRTGNGPDDTLGYDHIQLWGTHAGNMRERPCGCTVRSKTYFKKYSMMHTFKEMDILGITFRLNLEVHVGLKHHQLVQ